LSYCPKLAAGVNPTFNLENVVGREKDVQAIDLNSVVKKCVVTYTDVGYADNAGCNYLSPYW